MKTPSPKIVLVTSVMSFKPPLPLCWNPWRGRQAPALTARAYAPDETSKHQQGRNSEVGMGWESDKKESWGGRSRKGPTVGASSGFQNPCLCGSQGPPCARPSSLLINSACTHSQLWASAHTGSAGMPRSPPTEHSLHARHCVQCFTCATPFCPHDATRDEGPLLHFTGEEARAAW